MKRITLPRILHALQRMEHRVEVPEQVAARARGAVERMLAIGRTEGRTEARSVSPLGSLAATPGETGERSLFA